MKTLSSLGLLILCLGSGFCLAAGAASVVPPHAGSSVAEAKVVPKKAPAAKKPATRTGAKTRAVTAKAPASKSKARKKAEVIANQLPKPKLDLSLPKTLVDDLKPPSKMDAETSKNSILPSLFDKSDADRQFQLNGRLLSNEMQLQLRNDRQEVEGAALEFQFKQ